MMRALGLIKQVKQFTDLLQQFNVTEKNRHIKGLDEKDTEVIIKLGTGSQ
jgi:hypothetical protein